MTRHPVGYRACWRPGRIGPRTWWCATDSDGQEPSVSIDLFAALGPRTSHCLVWLPQPTMAAHHRLNAMCFTSGTRQGRAKKTPDERNWPCQPRSQCDSSARQAHGGYAVGLSQGSDRSASGYLGGVGDHGHPFENLKGCRRWWSGQGRCRLDRQPRVGRPGWHRQPLAKPIKVVVLDPGAADRAGRLYHRPVGSRCRHHQTVVPPQLQPYGTAGRRRHLNQTLDTERLTLIST
jgi:hypothetical protein